MFYVAKLQTATPEMFGFPVSVMILVMVVFGGIGSVWGVVLGAVHPAAAAILVAAGSDRVAARARPAGRQRLAAADRSGAVDRADLRHHPGADDAVPPRGADPGDAQAGGADLRPAARRGAARRLHRSGAARAGRRRAHRRGGAGDQGRHREVRRPGGAERGGHRGAGRRRGRGDRAERLGQVHAVQRDHRAGGGGGGLDPVPRRGDHGAAAARDPGEGHRAHVPEHPAVPQPDGDGERADRPARAAAHRRDLRGDPAPARHARRGGAGAANGRWRSSRSSATG